VTVVSALELGRWNVSERLEQPPCTLAVTAVSSPVNVVMKASKTATTRVSVRIQNRGIGAVTIPDRLTLEALVRLRIDSLGGCLPPAVQMRPSIIDRRSLVLKSKQTMSVLYDVTFACANDPLDSTTKHPGHDDFEVTATVDHAALGSADGYLGDDVCPRAALVVPYGSGTLFDRGCGARRADGTFGGPILIDVVVRP
jgi:hypothetical protein